MSMYLIKARNQQKSGKLGKPEPGDYVNYAQIHENHPDIANPPSIRSSWRG